MKNIFRISIGIIITLLAAACSNNSSEQKTVSDKNNDTASIKMEHSHETEETALTLNNGVKWKADSITNVNVEQLIRITENDKTKTLNDYQEIGNNIQGGINKLVKDCKMQGDDHEALHHWLEPLLKKNDALIKSSSFEQAQKIFQEEKQHLNLYHNYFE